MNRRVAALAGGTGVTAVISFSPLGHLDHHLLTAHMVQHLLLMLVAAPLMLWGLPPGWRTRVPPVAGWLAGSLTVIFWHLPPFFELPQQAAFWHGFERASFLAAGLLFWCPVLGRSGWTVPVYLFLATLPCDALSAFLAFCGHVVYRGYLHHSGMFGLSALEDQELAGALMWAAVTFAYGVPALVAAGRLLANRTNPEAAAGLTLRPAPPR